MGGNEKDNRLAELLNMERLQNLLDNLAKALDLAFVAVDYRGCPVTAESGFCSFCDCMKKHEQYGRMCNQCYAHAGLHATMSGAPHVYRCHAGLVEFAVPLMVDGKYIYHDTPYLPKNCKDWNEGALADFSGFINTKVNIMKK